MATVRLDELWGLLRGRLARERSHVLYVYGVRCTIVHLREMRRAWGRPPAATDDHVCNMQRDG